jgi:hypothetical protein
LFIRALTLAPGREETTRATDVLAPGTLFV